ncbi:hypothetical protein [Nocardia bhagyanarayanae]|uniref:Uncharacterized protein n=1 Tax=Nocardia bhagyanarayanae TaxID=1215925 RepID=A0A543FDJ6_9NOCA|nr:hypothetical protein [Nocardia bhagyanarayanae]TQM31786.1 hypothetical protein FB390_3456 [Nocardia bhagyanarayanae]
MNRLLHRFGVRSWDGSAGADLDGIDPRRQLPSPGTGADRRWAAIGRGTPDLASAAGSGGATSAEVVR